MTLALYLKDSYLAECDATVRLVRGKEVVLDQTIFYPRGGGQPSDTGKIIITSTTGVGANSVANTDSSTGSGFGGVGVNARTGGADANARVDDVGAITNPGVGANTDAGAGSCLDVAGAGSNLGGANARLMGAGAITNPGVGANADANARTGGVVTNVAGGVGSAGVGAGASEFRVVNVMKKDGELVHELDRDADFASGARVKCVLDWERRHKLMRMHTAAHVLSAVMHREFNILITGNQLEEDKTRFDFAMETFDRSMFEAVVGKANEALGSGAVLRSYDLPREDAMKIPGVVKLAGALPPSITVLRMVEIPGIDLQADGGTHVRSLKEVGKIGILKLENKGRENRRIYFTLSG